MNRLWRTLFALLLGLFVLIACLGLVGWRHRKELAYLFIPDQPAPPRIERVARPETNAKQEKSEPTAKPIAAQPERPMSWAGLKVEAYSGRFAGDGDAARALGDLDEALVEAIKDLKDGSGLYPSAQNLAQFNPSDYQACSFKQPFSVAKGGSGWWKAQFAVEPIMLKWWAARDLFAAALCQILLDENCPGYSAAPEWFQAGLVLNLTDFGHVYETRSLLSLSVPPIQAISGLGTGRERQWLNGYWAFRSIEARRGDEAIQLILGSLQKGADWQSALKACGEDEAVLNLSYREWASAYLKDKTANRDNLLGMISLLREQREEEAAPLLRNFVKEQPLDLYTGDATYWLGYCNYRLGKYEDSSRELSDLLTNLPYTTSLQSKASYFLGRSYQMMGYSPMALPEYIAAAREPENPLLVQLATAKKKAIQ